MSLERTRTVRGLIPALSGLLAIALIVLNVALVRQNRQLKQAVSASERSSVPTIGTTIKRLDGTRLNGSSFGVPFDHDSAPTLLLVFSTNCRFCDHNWPQWSSLAHSVQGRAVRIVYINLHSQLTSEYLSQHGVSDGQAYDQLDPKDEVALNLRITPLTVLIGANGRVERVWVGVLDNADVSQLGSEVTHALSRSR